MKKFILSLLFLFLSIDGYAFATARDLVGLWFGEMNFREGEISYTLMAKIDFDEDGKLVFDIQTEYAPLEVKDFHIQYQEDDTLDIRLSLIEHYKLENLDTYHFFRFELDGKMSGERAEEKFIEGRAEHFFDDDPVILRASGTFKLKKLRRPQKSQD